MFWTFLFESSPCSACSLSFDMGGTTASSSPPSFDPTRSTATSATFDDTAMLD
jgi:hypothetical protein